MVGPLRVFRMLLLWLLLASTAGLGGGCTGGNPEGAREMASPSTAISTAIPDEALRRVTRTPDPSGFIDGPGRSTVVVQCTGCHSGRLVQQNRATRAGWAGLIEWMRREQGFWKLEPSVEAEILDYLAAYYGRATVADNRRRPPLTASMLPPTRETLRERRSIEGQGRSHSGGPNRDAIQTD